MSETGKRSRVRRPQQSSVGHAYRRFRKDPSTRGLDYAQVCISVPIAELAAIDAAAEQAQMARSHFLRVAAQQFAERIRCDADDRSNRNADNADGSGASSASNTSRSPHRTGAEEKPQP